MGKVKERNIKNQTYYYFDNIIDKEVWVKLTKNWKKLHRDYDIYYIGYNTIKKLFNNPLFLIISSAAGYFEEEYGEKYLFLDSTEKYEEVFSGIKSEI